MGKIPERWLAIGERHSLLTTSPRRAITPAHAIWNLCYQLAEFACRTALLALGLDPQLGWAHRDAAYRDSAALDLVEAIRPVVDAHILDLLSSRTFARREFIEARDGSVRVAPSLAKPIVESTLPIWERAVAASAEGAARILAGSTTGVKVRTRLTQADRKSGRLGAGGHSKPKVPPACRICGLVSDDPGRSVCDDCLPDYDRVRTEKLSTAGKATLAAMRASRDDPARSPEATAKKREKSRSMSLAMRAWEREHGRCDPKDYEREILPAIQELTVPQLVKLTGLSQFHCWKVRKGERRLHARHWEAVRVAVTVAPGSRHTDRR